MRVNPAVVLLKFLPIAMTAVNVATAFVFMNACVPFMKRNSYYVMVNCTRAMIISTSKYEVKCELPL